jgi:hypothetical protein
MAADDATMEAVAKMKNLQELTICQKSSHCIATNVAIEKFTELRQLKVSMNFNFLTDTKLNAFFSEIISLYFLLPPSCTQKHL